MVVKPGNITALQRLKKVVGELGMNPLRRHFMQELTTAADGRILSGPEIIKNMNKYGPDTLKEILTQDQLKQVGQFVKTRDLPKFVESELERRLRSVIFESNGILRTPEEVVKRIVNGDTMTLRAVKRIVGEKGLEHYRRRIIEDILGEANLPLLPGQAPSPSALKIGKALKQYDQNFLREIFSAKDLDEISRLDDAKALIESTQRLVNNASGTSSALLAAGAAGSMVLTHPFKAAKIVVPMYVLARFYTSEAGRKLLMMGLDPKYVKHAPTATAIAARTTEAIRERMEQDRANGAK